MGIPLAANKKNQEVLKIRNKSLEFIPQQRMLNAYNYLFVHDQIQQSGHYELIMGEESIGSLAFNYNRKESVMRFYAMDDLKKLSDLQKGLSLRILSNDEKLLTQSMTEQQNGMQFWKLFLILAIVFLALEIIIIKLR